MEEGCVEASGPAATTSEGGLVVPSLSLRVASRTLLKDARLVLARGRRYGLVGKNGSGKSTLLTSLASKCLPGMSECPLRIAYVAQEELQDLGCITALERIVSGDEREVKLRQELDVLENSATQLSHEDACRMELIMQELEVLGAAHVQDRAHAMGTWLGLSNRQLEEPVPRLSGGMRMRVELARALLGDFDMLLLDEPTNHLDLESAMWLQHHLESSPSTVVVVVSHDAYFLDAVCTDIIQLHGQALVTTAGNYSMFEEHAREHANWQTGLHDKMVKKQARMKSFVEAQRNKALSGKADNKQLKQANNRAEKKLERLSYFRADGKPYKLFSMKFLGEKWIRYPQRVQQLRNDPAVRFTFSDPGQASTAAGRAESLITMSNVDFTYPSNQTPTLQEVTLEVTSDSRVALVGKNGSGKSTLLKLISGELSGNSMEGEQKICRLAGVKVGVVSQHHIEVLAEHLHQSAVEYLLEKIPALKTECDVRQHLGGFGLSGAMPLLKIEALSGGLKARLIFAEVMYHQPNVLLMDEPTNHLDFESIEALSLAVASFDGAVIVISHNSAFLCTCCDELWTVQDDGHVRITKTSEAVCFEDAFNKYRGAMGTVASSARVRWQPQVRTQVVSTAAF